MASSKSQSFFQDIKSRELNGFRVRKRSYSGIDSSRDLEPIGAVAVEHNGELSPPLALSFCKTNVNRHIVAVSDEGGYINLYNTRLKFHDSSTYQENTEKARVSEWFAHKNAIFDICWIKEDSNILTASGDQSIKVWDSEGKKCIRALMGHTGSIKAISSHPTNHDLLVSGSRDGSFALWDIRCSKNSHQKFCSISTAMVHEAHSSPSQRRLRHGKAASVSITSVLYLKDEISIATAGAVDSVIKFWDARNLKKPVTQACPNPKSTEMERRLHGISSLSQDLNGVFIAASCMDDRIYLYNALQLEKGAINTFSGCQIGSFWIKSSISPDASHILSGSSDGNAYVWQVQKPHMDPITLESHQGEVTAVDWCPSEAGKVATTSDDFTVQFWNIQSSFYSNIRSPSSIRRRIMAPGQMQRRKLFMDEISYKNSDTESSPMKMVCSINSSDPDRLPDVSTPESQKKILYCSEATAHLEKTPEAESPSSVLNPPSSLKRRTIRDYFLVA